MLSLCLRGGLSLVTGDQAGLGGGGGPFSTFTVLTSGVQAWPSLLQPLETSHHAYSRSGLGTINSNSKELGT